MSQLFYLFFSKKKPTPNKAGGDQEEEGEVTLCQHLPVFNEEGGGGEETSSSNCSCECFESEEEWYRD